MEPPKGTFFFSCPPPELKYYWSPRYIYIYRLLLGSTGSHLVLPSSDWKLVYRSGMNKYRILKVPLQYRDYVVSILKKTHLCNILSSKNKFKRKPPPPPANCVPLWASCKTAGNVCCDSCAFCKCRLFRTVCFCRMGNPQCWTAPCRPTRAQATAAAWSNINCMKAL